MEHFDTKQLAKSRLRTFQHKGKRAAIRLEEIYWEQLEAFARRDKVKLSRLISTIFDAIDDTGNRTACLRNYCLHRLTHTAGAAQNGYDANILAIMEACPLPAFTMTVERKMFAYNAAFKNEIENLGPKSKEAKGQAGLKMVFSNPVNQTAERLKDGTRNSVTGYIGFSLGDKLIQRKASFCLVDKRLENSPILVFIHP